MVVIGVDAHNRTHTLVAVDEAGWKVGERTQSNGAVPMSHCSETCSRPGSCTQPGRGRGRQARWRFGPGLVMTMLGTAAHRDSRVSARVSSAMSDVFIIWAGGIDS
jgi:hypothetical protein